MSRKKPASEMNFLDHLDELRSVLIKALIGLMIGVIVSYFFSPRIQDLLLLAFKTPENIRLSLLYPTEGFMVQLKISLVAGIFVAAPWIFYQFWSFVAPALYDNEKRWIGPTVFFTSLCFITGAVFAWFVLLWATSFLMGFASDGGSVTLGWGGHTFLEFGTPAVENVWSLGKTLDFILRMFLAFGVMFELPVAMYFLARLGLVDAKFLRTYRKHAYVLVLIAAAIITPPDVITQIALGLPLFGLYEISIYVAMIGSRRHKKAIDSMGQDEESSAKAGGAA